MKVTQVSILPTEASKKAGRPALTPELLAATGARYSRNNEGLESILKNINLGNADKTLNKIIEAWSDPDLAAVGYHGFGQYVLDVCSEYDKGNLDKGVDSIFKMVDYGHQSIADIVPVSMFLDDISVFLAYFLWANCPTASGQESSTRYVKMSAEGLVDPDLLGIAKEDQGLWAAYMDAAFEAYEERLKFWIDYGETHPELMRIPKNLMEDSSDKAKKQVERMKRNYAFDRSRYYIPVATKTNMMMVMSARSWVNLCVLLLSHPTPEMQELGNKIKEELALVAPRLIRHAVPHEAATALHAMNRYIAKNYDVFNPTCEPMSDGAYLMPYRQSGQLPSYDLVNDLKKRTNRYSTVGPFLANQFVTFGWKAVSIAEIRDFNRHRTGKKSCVLAPVGFYKADDQLLDDTKVATEKVVKHTTERAFEKLNNDDPSYVYWTLLGHQYPFEHTTSADHFIYESELRTGVGSHYKYAEHLHHILELWYEKYPETKFLIFEGSAEPE